MDSQRRPGRRAPAIIISLDAAGDQSLPPALDDAPAPAHAVVALRGELDLATAAHAGGSLERLIARGASSILVDAGELSFCGAAGLRVLLACHAHLRSDGGTFGILNPSDQLQRLLEITGLSYLLDERPTPAVVFDLVRPAPRREQVRRCAGHRARPVDGPDGDHPG